jgi:magnesium transporter
MIQILKDTTRGLEPMDEVTSGCWVNVVDPGPSELERLAELGLPQDFILYPLDVDERPRSEKEDDGKLLVLIRIPYFQGESSDIPYTTIPMGIILMDSYIVTICRHPNDVIKEFSAGRVRGLSTSKRNRFLLRILLATAGKYLNNLREINKNVDAVEDRLQVSMQNREVNELLKYQKSLVYFTTALKSNELMMERLQRSSLFRQYPDDEDLLEDVITENQQAIEMVNISNNILSSMMGAFASIISNNLNQVMKFLASMTILLSIPTIVTSFFGMNVNLPFADHQLAPLFVLGISFTIAVIVVIVFNKRKWF